MDKKSDSELDLSYVRLRNTINGIRHRTGRQSIRKKKNVSFKGHPKLGFSNNSVFTADDDHPSMYKKQH